MNKIDKLLCRLLVGFSLVMVSPWALAAGETPWKMYLGVVMTISLIIASWLGFRSEKAESRLAKLLLTGLYFWVFTFAQLTVLAFIYYINK